MNQPRQPALWEFTLTAVQAAIAAGKGYVDSGKYVPRRATPKYEENDHGWSTTTSTRNFNTSVEDPIDWDHMLNENRGDLKYVLVSEIPVLEASIRGVVSLASEDPEFEKRLVRFPLGDPGSQQRSGQVRSTFIGFVAEIILRLEATQADGPDGILDIYLALETARFADSLVGDVVVPIALTALETAEPLELAPGIWVEPLDKQMQMARAVDWWSGGRVSPHVIAAATHAVVFRGISIDNRDPVMRWRNIEDVVDMPRVELVFQCLHIASGKEAGYAQVLIRPTGWADSWEHDLPSILRVGEYHRYPHRLDRGGWNREKSLVSSEITGRLPRMFTALEAAEENVKFAARRAFSTSLRTDDEDRTLDATIGLECLLSGGDKGEITHRMAQRAAAALAAEGSHPDIIFASVKKVYAHRSAIVHGARQKERTKTATINLRGKEFPTWFIARLILRKLLSSLLLADHVWTPQSLDEQILSALQPSEHRGEAE